MKGSEIPVRKVSTGKRRWMLDCRYVGGRREFYETKELAEEARERKLTEVKRYGVEALTLSNDERLDFVRARDRLKKISATIEQAVVFYEANHKELDSVLFSEAIGRIIETKKAANLDPDYVRKFQSHLASLMALTTDKPLAQVSRDEIEAWLFKSQWKPATIRNLRIDVRTFFRFAFDRRWIPVNPALHLAAVKLPDTPPGILTVPECESLLKASRTQGAVLPYVVLNLLCGLRPEECVQLVPGNIHVKRGFIEVPAKVAKSRQRRIVELSKSAKAWLAIAPEIKPRSPKWYARQIPKLKADASEILNRPMPWPKNCLRHSFASYHLARYGSADKTATQMGHRDTSMLFRHYRELVDPAQARRFFSLYP
jgi:integrase